MDDDDDAFWDIQLKAGNNNPDNSDDENALLYSSDTTWLAPQDREGLNIVTCASSNHRNKNAEGQKSVYEWIDIPIQTLQHFEGEDVSTAVNTTSSFFATQPKYTFY
mmetsp:Transcript_26964/g.40509  ORF Transcript_26964/g.40509 Transcript_26964/m.40509 type:complete len:107 (+) Transcript_26964:106-426(+)